MAALNDEQTMLRDMAREWADNESPVSAFRRLRDASSSTSFDGQSWAAIGAMGWAGIVVPEDHGGSAFGYRSLGLVVEQLGRNLVASPLVASAIAASAIASGGSDPVKSTWLPRIAMGQAVAAFAVDEGPRHDGIIRATVVDGRLTGRKAFVAEGDSADLFVVAAADGLYAVERTVQVSVTARQMADARSHADVTFDGAPAQRLGGPELTTATLDRAAALASAEMLGMANSAFEQTLEYLKQRVQFGQRLSAFQALQHRMARMLTEIELLRSAVEEALEAIDRDDPNAPHTTSLAKALAGDTLKLVSREMVQLFGGVGMTDEYDAGLYLKRAATLEQMWGNAGHHRDRYGRLNGY